MGLKSFSMHPSQVLQVKQQILRSDAAKLTAFAQQVLASEDPSSLMNP
jgi:phosphotransferase system enzyme I (PtsI)